MWNYPDIFLSCLENLRSSGNTWTVLKVSGKLEMIWKYLDSFETVWKIKDYLKKNYSFETVWKFEITWKKLDSFETVPKTPNNLEISEYFVSFGIIWNTFELPEFFQIINRLLYPQTLSGRTKTSNATLLPRILRLWHKDKTARYRQEWQWW